MSRAAPVTNQELLAVLSDLGVQVRASRAGAVVAVIDGDEVKIGHAAKPKAVVNPVTLRRIAKACGADSYGDLLRGVFGRDQNAGKEKQALVEAPKISKAEVRAVCTSLRSKAHDVDRWLAHGHHDPDTYVRVAFALRDALHAIREYPPKDGEWDAPSDKGFVPCAPDPVLTGAARVTGAAARAVRRGTTFAQWEMDE